MFTNALKAEEMYSDPESYVLFVPATSLLSITWPSLGLLENKELRWRAKVKAYMLKEAMGACAHGKNVCKEPF